jgi:uncharacterized protein YkwD
MLYLPLLSLLLSVASAAPAVVVVTQTVITTVVVEGATQSLNDAPVFTTSDSNTSTTQSLDLLLTTLATTPSPVPTTLATSTNPTTTSTTPVETTTSQSNSDSSFESQILNEHNIKRALHNVPALSWDDTLASYAQNYADQYDCSGNLQHSGGAYGENLALGYTITGSVDAWYSEGDNYDYGAGCSVYDHFTQVVWKSTTKVGCGYKNCNSYWGTYIVCSYDPAGNFIGQCDQNVTPLA